MWLMQLRPFCSLTPCHATTTAPVGASYLNTKVKCCLDSFASPDVQYVATGVQDRTGQHALPVIGRAPLTSTGQHCIQGQNILQHTRGAEILRSRGMHSMCPHAMPQSQSGLSCMPRRLVARWKTLCGRISTEPPFALQTLPGMQRSMSAPHTLYTQPPQSMTTDMGSQITVSLVAGMLATEPHCTERQPMAMLAMLLHKAGRWGTGRPAMTTTNPHTGTTVAAELWTSLRALMLVLMPIGTHPGFQIPAVIHTLTAMWYLMTDGMTGNSASCPPEAAPECSGLTEEAPDWPGGLRGTLWVSAEVGPTHTAGMTVDMIQGMTSCLLGRSQASTLLGLLVSTQLLLPDLTEMGYTRAARTTGMLDLALYPGADQ